MYPGVALSRSFGDFSAHKIGVISEPSTGSVGIERQNEFLVIATRGVWNVLTPKEVFSFIKNNQSLGIGLISQALAKHVHEIYAIDKL